MIVNSLCLPNYEELDASKLDPAMIEEIAEFSEVRSDMIY